MAYQALYRKYRPASFEEMVGQQQITRTLKNAVESGRISHAYLFCGPRGTGKTSAAKIFARALNCEADSGKPCGQCENCREQNHPDIIEIDAASNNGVEEVRNLIDRVKYAPMLGKYKVYIIDEVHMMTAGAFNALLKTIEEPPAHVIFILATTEPHKVLPTIISRCQRYDFKKVPSIQIVDRLNEVAGKENVKLDLEAAKTIATLSDGGMRDALSILDQCIAYSPKEVKPEDVRDIYGVVSRKDLAELFQHLARGEVKELVDTLELLSNNGMDLMRLTGDLIHLLKDSLVYSYSEDTTLVDEEEKQILNTYVMHTSLDARKTLLEKLMAVTQLYPSATNVLDYLESTLLQTVSDFQKEERNEISEISSPISTQTYEKTSEQAEIPKNPTENSGKTTVLDILPPSDVSRETISDRSDNDFQAEIPALDSDFLLSLLVGANKKERAKDVQALQRNQEYERSFDWGKFANLIQGVKVGASGSQYILFHTADNLKPDLINRMEERQGFGPYMKELLGAEKKVFCIPSESYVNLVNEFRNRMNAGTLPSAPDFSMKKKENKELTVEEALKQVFPDLKVVED